MSNDLDLKIENTYPPNYKQICDRFPKVKEVKDVLFVWDIVLHNPHKIQLLDHVIIHETVHSYQQNGKPEEWYKKYFEDKKFRLQQEVEAYGMQYAYILEQTKDKNQRYSLLFQLAQKMNDPIYDFGMNYMQCELLIKKEAKRHNK